MKIKYWPIALLGLLYPVGAYLRKNGIGTHFTKEYVSDFGFVFVWAYVLFSLFGLKIRIALIATTLVALGYEAIQFIIGKGNPFDCVTYLLALIIGWILTSSKPLRE